MLIYRASRDSSGNRIQPPYCVKDLLESEPLFSISETAETPPVEWMQTTITAINLYDHPVRFSFKRTEDNKLYFTEGLGVWLAIKAFANNEFQNKKGFLFNNLSPSEKNRFLNRQIVVVSIVN